MRRPPALRCAHLDDQTEQNTTFIEVYPLANGSGHSSYYKIGQVAAQGNSSGHTIIHLRMAIP